MESMRGGMQTLDGRSGRNWTLLWGNSAGACGCTGSILPPILLVTSKTLARFVEALRGGKPPAAVRYLLTSPADKSACKRMNLYLRWMIRRTHGCG